MQDLQKIEKIFRMLGSTHDGEILNAVNAIRRTLIAQNKNFSDLAAVLFRHQPDFTHLYRQAQQAPPKNRGVDKYSDEYPELIRMAKYLIDMPTTVNNWEGGFISDIYTHRLLEGYPLSEKQVEHLKRIYQKYYKA